MKQISTTIQCLECDSETTLHFHQSNVSGPVKFCPFCGEDLDKSESPIEIDETVFQEEDDWINEEEE